MTWVRHDDKYYLHPKIRTIGPAGRELFGVTLEYCNRERTNGFVPEHVVTELAGVIDLTPSQIRKVIPKLLTLAASVVALGFKEPLWAKVDGGYMIHDYDEYQGEAMTDRKQVRSEAGKRGAEARWGKRDQARNGSESDGKSHGKPDSKSHGAEHGKSHGKSMPPFTRLPDSRDSINSPSVTVGRLPSDKGEPHAPDAPATPETSNGSDRGFQFSPRREKQEAITAIVKLTGDDHSSKRFGQLYDLADRNGRSDLWDAAVQTTEAAITKASLPPENPGAYFNSILGRLLQSEGIGVTVGTPEARNEVQQAILDSLAEADEKPPEPKRAGGFTGLGDVDLSAVNPALGETQRDVFTGQRAGSQRKRGRRR